MRLARAFGVFAADLLFGDDWRMSLGIVVSFGLCAAVTHAGVAGWWLPPLGVVLVLGYSLHRASRVRPVPPPSG